MKTLVLVLLVGLAGCPGPRAVRLDQLTLAQPVALEPGLRSGRRFVVTRFVDERGAEFSRMHATSHMPVINWFHSGHTAAYPESAGLVRESGGRRDAVAVGAFDVALPSLLATTMKKMGLSPNVSATAEASLVAPVTAPEMDYVVSGRLRKAKYTTHESLIACIALGLLGVPFQSQALELELEVYLFQAGAPEHPIWQRSYHFADRRIGGLYYNHPTAHPLFVRALEATLPEVVRDLAVAVRTQG
jgi:hypothetical protein